MGGSGLRRAVLLAVSLTAIAAGLAFVLLHVTSPSDGARLAPGESSLRPEGVIVTPLLETPGGLRAGDLVVAVAGRPMQAWAEDLFRPALPVLEFAPEDLARYSVLRDGEVLTLAVPQVSYPLGTVLRANWGTILFALIFQVVASYVFARRPGLPATGVLFLSASSILSATTWSFGLQVSDFIHGTGFWLFKLTTLGFYTLFWIAGLHFALLFPRPLPLVKRRSWLVPALYLLPYAVILSYTFLSRQGTSGALDWIDRWLLVEGVIPAALLPLALLAFFRQYATHSEGATRQQIQWVIWASLLAGGGGLLAYLLPRVLGAPTIDSNLMGVIILPFPLALAVAILRHNLFDIDVLINRTLVYGILTGIVVGFYVLIVGALSAIFQARGGLLVSLLATVAVAVAFQPLRDRLQKSVNRLMYGDRDDPVAVITALGEQLQATLAPEDVLPGMVRTVARALKVPYVAVLLPADEPASPAASYGRPPAGSGPEDLLRLPLAFQGERVGDLVVAPRSQEEPFSPRERLLLENIARQAGAAVYTVRLTEALQRSRRSLVTAREEERRRLRRDLHDGLGPQLAGLSLKLEAAHNLLGRDPAGVDRLLVELKSQTQAAVVDIRRLVYGLRPPALDEVGLAAAIQQQAASFTAGRGLAVRVEAPEALPPLPAAVEVAAYRIALEALTNVAHHAAARNCVIRLQVDGSLSVEVEDDGVGIRGESQAGVGLTSMRERAVEVGGTFEVGQRAGGGTRLRARIPLEPPFGRAEKDA